LQVGLSLSNNQLTEIKGLENLVGLQLLDLFNNQLTEIKGLEKLVALQELSLSNNQLTEIKGLEKLIALQKLFLFNNLLMEIKGLENLVGLQELSLFNNRLTEIKGLENLVGLQQLNLSFYLLTEIKGLEYLVGLQQLSLSFNQLTEIKGLENLVGLQELSLSDNQLMEIKGLEKLINHLNYLSIDNNPFLKETDLLLKEYDNHRDIILKYFSDIDQKKVDVTLPAKVMLLGNHASGKTTFRHYMLNGELIEPESTHILNIVPYWEEQTKLPKAIIFDFGGQDYYHGLYQAFFSEDPIYMLFWCNKSNQNDVQQANDETKSNTRNFTKEYWMRQLAYVYTKRNRERKKMGLNSLAEDSFVEPLLLIQTYAEEEKEEADETEYWEEMQLRLKNTVGEYYISLNEDTGQDPLRELQRKCVKDLLLREITKKRKSKKENAYYKSFLERILSVEEEECVEVNKVLEWYNREEDNEEKKRTFLEVELQTLNRKGLVLYYKENDLLKDVVWLNPTKTVEYIHENVLSEKNIKKEYNGTVPQEDFDEFSDEKIRELLKCEKVIFFDENNKQYIIPGYLQLSSDDEYYKLLNSTLTD
jgi:internalin A